ncbi:MAG: glycoprotein endopeptidase metalloprotease [Phycisphaeraceae bacterium]|nr:MAG: glycoprotein endopeptidase metalloprotease [Phycisphaeraceae bacterium]
MGDPMNNKNTPASRSGRVAVVLFLLPFELLGRKTLTTLEHIGAVMSLQWQATLWMWRALTNRKVRVGKAAMVSQLCRIGVQSILIVSLVSGAVGLILALQLAPPLDDFGQREKLANIISVAVLRELGPLIGAIVLTGFAGASIAAEIGTMVVSEEIEALEAHALNPVRFLVVPRVVAATIAMTILGVLSSFMAIFAALLVSVLVLDIPFETFVKNILIQSDVVDFWTGTVKGAVFGMLIGIIACTNGLKVSGGAAGVGRATTFTVVECVVSIVVADLIFTTIFFALDLN